MRNLILLSVLFLSACGGGQVAVHDQAYFQCPPASTLRVCAIGNSPTDVTCEPVGTGTSTLPIDCP